MLNSRLPHPVSPTCNERSNIWSARARAEPLTQRRATSVEVSARRNLVTWDKNSAKQLLDSIVACQRSFQGRLPFATRAV